MLAVGSFRARSSVAERLVCIQEAASSKGPFSEKKKAAESLAESIRSGGARREGILKGCGANNAAITGE